VLQLCMTMTCHWVSILHFTDRIVSSVRPLVYSLWLPLISALSGRPETAPPQHRLGRGAAQRPAVRP